MKLAIVYIDKDSIKETLPPSPLKDTHCHLGIDISSDNIQEHQQLIFALPNKGDILVATVGEEKHYYKVLYRTRLYFFPEKDDMIVWYIYVKQGDCGVSPSAKTKYMVDSDASLEGQIPEKSAIKEKKQAFEVYDTRHLPGRLERVCADSVSPAAFYPRLDDDD